MNEPSSEAPAWDALELALQIIHATGGDPKRAKEAAAAIDRFRAEERERCAKIAETFFPPAHTYASENADVYHAQDDAQRRIAARIRGEQP